MLPALVGATSAAVEAEPAFAAVVVEAMAAVAEPLVREEVAAREKI